MKCGHGVMGETDNSSEWFTKCDDCGHLLFCYEPMPHQLRFHMDQAKFKLFAGGLTLDLVKFPLIELEA